MAADWAVLSGLYSPPPDGVTPLTWLERRFGTARSQVLSGNLTDSFRPVGYNPHGLRSLFDVQGDDHCFTVAPHRWARFHEPQITGGLVHFLSTGDLATQLGRCIAFYRTCCRCGLGKFYEFGPDDVVDWEVIEEEPTAREHGPTGRKRVERGKIDILIEFELENGEKAGAALEAKFDHVLTPGQLAKYSAHLERERQLALDRSALILVTRQPEALFRTRHWQSVTWWRFLIVFERELNTFDCSEFRRFRRTIWKAAYAQ